MDERMDASNGGRITDELRNHARLYEQHKRAHIEHIADRIDAEHERQLEVLYRDMSDAEYVELPVDADGAPIHVGDVMEWPDGKTFDVVGIGDGVLFYIENADGPADWTGASTKHHHKPPTVEDVLDEFASAYDRIGGEDEEHQKYLNLIAEYAAKLRLAGDAE